MIATVPMHTDVCARELERAAPLAGVQEVSPEVCK